MPKNVSKIIVFADDIPQDFQLGGDIAIDTETTGLNYYRDRLCLLQFSNGNNISYLVQFKDRDYRAPNLRKFLADDSKCKIFHFARFDLAMLRMYLQLDIKNIFCTKIASRLTRTYTDAHSLKSLCGELLNVSLSKQQQSSDWGHDILTEEQKEYAARDVLYLHKIKDILTNMLIREKRLDLAQEIFKFLPTRVALDLTGWSESDIFAH